MTMIGGETVDIRRAKEEVKNAVRAYIAKDEDGEPLIPEVRQRPVLLIGPPGIGKTAIMQQAARELGVGLAAYTMTHHTRQSAMGLPFIEKKIYNEEEYSVTSYTMSEIIASVYDIIERTGLENGILFIDEINCVSETLSPVMLQFLQGKMFGNTKVPEGWVIVAAGNPVEYNRSVREFDVVTLDRVKLINIEPDYTIWKEYARTNGVHQAILSYLDARQENFYRIETTIDGKRFVTARGWEDLSDMIKASERLGITVDLELIEQYLQHSDVAMDFNNYLSLYYKYEKAYSVDDILCGNADENMMMHLKNAPFDERISVVSLMLGGLNTHFREYYIKDSVVTECFEFIKMFCKDESRRFVDMYDDYEAGAYAKMEAGLLDANQRSVKIAVSKQLSVWRLEYFDAHSDREEFLKAEFAKLNAKREGYAEDVSMMLENAFDFAEEVYGTGPEMALFVTELAAGYYSLNFIQETGCDRFYQYNRTMLRDNSRNRLLDEINGD